MGPAGWFHKAWNFECAFDSQPVGGNGPGSDEDITPMDTHNTPQDAIEGPITRARARQLNHQVSSLLCNSFNDFEDRLLPNDIIILRNYGEDQRALEGGLGGGEGQEGRPSQVGGPIHTKFETDSDSRTIPY